MQGELRICADSDNKYVDNVGMHLHASDESFDWANSDGEKVMNDLCEHIWYLIINKINNSERGAL